MTTTSRSESAASRFVRSTPIEQAFHYLEDKDAERVPVVEAGGRLAGVLSRSVLQRRLAEDEGEVDGVGV